MLVARRSTYAEVTATITGTLLACDAWFDVLTSRGTSDIAQALSDRNHLRWMAIRTVQGPNLVAAVV
jgi:hypothetical protein